MLSKRRTLAVSAGGLVILAVAGYLLLVRRPAAGGYTSATIDRGDIVEVVGATGTLQAVTTVQVGSQVSGIIQSLHADFNSVVKKGQVIARIDPSNLEARLGQARANLVAARANAERARAQVADSRQKYGRAKELFAENLLPTSELETAQVNFDSAVAQQRANEAAVEQAAASVNQAEVDLRHTVIETPIDGVVIARSVDVGQTVAASFQAPVLFTIANDLTKMQVNASIDEADIGRVRAGQDVTFRVDAFPDRDFPGRVEQVRLLPTTVQNVVTYNTIIGVDNPQMRLMPGMTATVSVVVDRRDAALRLPVAALRFKPPDYAPAPSPRSEPTAGAGNRQRPGDGQGSRGERRGRGEGGRTDGGGKREGESRKARHSTVFLLDGTKAVPTRIETGLSDGRFVEVLSGLSEGAMVIVGLGDTPAKGASPQPSPSGTNPFSPQRPQRRER